MKNWQFVILILTLLGIAATISTELGAANRRLQYIQEILEEQWTIMDSSAYAEIDRYKDMPEEELFEAEQW